MPEKPKIVAVIGGSQCSREETELAEEVGRLLARKGVVLVCGGLSGVMEAACRGAASAGGLTVGILPGEKRNAANPFVKLPIVTGIGYARNVAVVRTAQAVIAVGGSYGTLSEIGHALQNGIPVIGLNTWRMSRSGQEDTSIIRAENAIDAVELALSLAAE